MMIELNSPYSLVLPQYQNLQSLHGLTKFKNVSFRSRYGRRIIILISLSIQAVFGVGAAFAPNFYTYIALRFMVGTSISGIIINAFVLG